MPQGPIVGIITLTAVISTPSSMVIRPNNVGALTELETGQIQGLDNYIYVKEIICNDAWTYVFNDELITKTDLYEFDDISIPSGYTYDINSLMVVARNLSICELSPLYDYRIILSIDDGATIFKSSRLPVKETIDLSEFLVTDFGSTSWVWESNPQPGYHYWSEVTDTNIIFERNFMSSATYDGKMWLMGGYDYINFNNDVWNSTDGLNWSQVTDNALWSGRWLHSSLNFNNKLWVIGGQNISGGLNDIWNSTDGLNWSQVTDNALWSKRIYQTSLNYDNKMWIFGGIDYDTFIELNDIWNSTDGLNWSQVTDNALWLPRLYATPLVFDNKMWMMGGYDYNTGNYFNDVWYSINGLNWIQTTNDIGWPDRIRNVSLSFNDKMWMMGGTDNRPITPLFFNDVWCSDDGITWSEVTDNAPWVERNEFYSFNYNNKMWIMGGYNETTILEDSWSCFDPIYYYDRLSESNINNLQIGIEVSSPSNTGSHDTHYYPNGTGTFTQLIPHGSINNWENINDPNNGECYGGSIYNYTTEYLWPYTFDMYNITTEASPIIRAGTINYITIRAHAMYSGSDGAYCSLVGIIPGYPGTFSGANNTDLSNSNYFQSPIEHSWDTHPFTGNPWTWTDIDNLEIGVNLQCLSGSNWARLCSVELIVNSNYPEQPTIATSQLYATVNMNLNQTITCTLPKPVDINVNHDIETKGLNFWSGNREVYTIGRSSKRTTLSGLLWNGCTDGISTCEQIIACIRTLGKYKKPIDLTGLRYPDLNVEYNIVAFSWKQIQEKPNTYEWELELEFRDLMNWGI